MVGCMEGDGVCLVEDVPEVNDHLQFILRPQNNLPHPLLDKWGNLAHIFSGVSISILILPLLINPSLIIFFRCLISRTFIIGSMVRKKRVKFVLGKPYSEWMK